jgi:2-iminobutanoate/2-iminopropanoate deaminase
MEKRELVAPEAGSVDSPYSQAILVGNVVILSGQIPTDSSGTTVGEGDMAAQVEQVFKNMDALLREAGGGLADLVSLTYYLPDITRLAEVFDVRRRMLSKPYPTTTSVEVARLWSDEWLLEVSGFAVLD